MAALRQGGLCAAAKRFIGLKFKLNASISHRPAVGQWLATAKGPLSFQVIMVRRRSLPGNFRSIAMRSQLAALD
jgi:hypothetical protein